MMRIKSSTYYLITFICLTIALLFLAVEYFAPKYKYQAPAAKVATAFKSSKTIAPFKLQDSNGGYFSEKSLRGHWTLLFFGYTNCPDICPRTLGMIRDSWNMFATANTTPPARFVFADISQQPVDAAELRQFLQNYNPEFLGITGSSAEMHQLSDQLGIYSQEIDAKLDHTAALMLIDTQGKLRAVLTPPFTAEDIVHDLNVLTHS